MNQEIRPLEPHADNPVSQDLECVLKQILCRIKCYRTHIISPPLASNTHLGHS
jgi:hypothetical protein